MKKLNDAIDQTTDEIKTLQLDLARNLETIARSLISQAQILREVGALPSTSIMGDLMCLSDADAAQRTTNLLIAASEKLSMLNYLAR